jgi:hypothetical protein
MAGAGSTTRIRWTAAVGGVALSMSLAACGLTLQQGAEPLASDALPSALRLPAPAAPPSSGSDSSAEPRVEAAPSPSRLWLWFVHEDGLAAVESALPVGSSPDLILQSLAIGPTSDHVAEGLRTVSRDPLTGQTLVSLAEEQPQPPSTALRMASSGATVPLQDSSADSPEAVTVALNSDFSALPPTEQVLLLGQVVLSLAGSGAQMVAFTDDSGSPVAVPLPDGRLLDVPAVARDYSGLIVRP